MGGYYAWSSGPGPRTSAMNTQWVKLEMAGMRHITMGQEGYRGQPAAQTPLPITTVQCQLPLAPRSSSRGEAGEEDPLRIKNSPYRE